MGRKAAQRLQAAAAESRTGANYRVALTSKEELEYFAIPGSSLYLIIPLTVFQPSVPKQNTPG